MNDRGAVEWTIGRLLSIVLLMIFLVIVIWGFTTGGIDPLVDKIGGQFDSVLILLNLRDGGAGDIECLNRSVGSVSGGEEFLESMMWLEGREAERIPLPFLREHFKSLNICKKEPYCQLKVIGNEFIYQDDEVFSIYPGATDSGYAGKYNSLEDYKLEGDIGEEAFYWELYNGFNGLLKENNLENVFEDMADPKGSKNLEVFYGVAYDFGWAPGDSLMFAIGTGAIWNVYLVESVYKDFEEESSSIKTLLKQELNSYDMLNFLLSNFDDPLLGDDLLYHISVSPKEFNEDSFLDSFDFSGNNLIFNRLKSFDLEYSSNSHLDGSEDVDLLREFIKIKSEKNLLDPNDKDSSEEILGELKKRLSKELIKTGKGDYLIGDVLKMGFVYGISLNGPNGEYVIDFEENLFSTNPDLNLFQLKGDDWVEVGEEIVHKTPKSDEFGSTYNFIKMKSYKLPEGAFTERYLVTKIYGLMERNC